MICVFHDAESDSLQIPRRQRASGRSPARRARGVGKYGARGSRAISASPGTGALPSAYRRSRTTHCGAARCGPRKGRGFQVDRGFAGAGWVGHDGGFPGVEAFATYQHPATGHTLVVLSNHNDSALPYMEDMKSEFQDHYGSAKIGGV
jgi:hypothetical protein